MYHIEIHQTYKIHEDDFNGLRFGIIHSVVHYSSHMLVVRADMPDIHNVHVLANIWYNPGLVKFLPFDSDDMYFLKSRYMP